MQQMPAGCHVGPVGQLFLRVASITKVIGVRFALPTLGSAREAVEDNSLEAGLADMQNPPTHITCVLTANASDVWTCRPCMLAWCPGALLGVSRVAVSAESLLLHKPAAPAAPRSCPDAQTSMFALVWGLGHLKQRHEPLVVASGLHLCG